MQVIEIIVDNKKYQIEWALSEHFDELKGKKYMMNEVAADQIAKITDLSVLDDVKENLGLDMIESLIDVENQSGRKRGFLLPEL